MKRFPIAAAAAVTAALLSAGCINFGAVAGTSSPSPSGGSEASSPENSLQISVPESSADISLPEGSSGISLPESSVQPSAPESSEEPEDKSEEYLKEYAETMAKTGTEKVSRQYSESPEFTWKVQRYDIKDFNNDGSPELVIQYGCQLTGAMYNRLSSQPPQGIALEIVKCENEICKPYHIYDSLGEYVRFAGSDVASYEIVDELCIDSTGALCIYHTNTSGTSSVSTNKKCYRLTDSGFELTDSLSVWVDGYWDPNDVYQPQYASYSITSDNLLVYHFNIPSEAPGNEGQFIDLNSALRLYKKFQALEIIPEYRVSESIVKNMEQSGNYDITAVTFCTAEEIRSEYYKRQG